MTKKIDFDKLTDEQIKQIVDRIQYEEKFNKIDLIYPDNDTTLMSGIVLHSRSKYQKQIDVMEAHGKYPVVVYRAGNQNGKSFCNCAITTYHLTGNYPSWYKGFKFKKPPRTWLIGETSESVKDTLQRKLLGEVGEFGSGLIPRKDLDWASLKDVKRAETSISSFRVKWAGGGFSTASFKSYTDGRKTFQAEAVDLIVMDEEPPMDIFNECVARTLASGGRMLMGFTPLQGITDVVKVLTDNGNFDEGEKAGGKVYVVTSDVYQIPHIDKEQIELMERLTPTQDLRDARLRGIPSTGLGVVYPINVDDFVISPFKLPQHFKYCMAIDFGWIHPTACLWIAFDTDKQIYYVVDEYKKSQAPPSEHAQEILMRDAYFKHSVYKICDPSKGAIEPKSGRHVAEMYKDYELEFEKANNDVDTGIFRVLQAFNNGQLFIFSTCPELVQELRTYRYDKKGKIYKVNDDLADCLRYVINADPDNFSSPLARSTNTDQIAKRILADLNRRKMFP